MRWMLTSGRYLALLLALLAGVYLLLNEPVFLLGLAALAWFFLAGWWSPEAASSSSKGAWRRLWTGKS